MSCLSEALGPPCAAHLPGLALAMCGSPSWAEGFDVLLTFGGFRGFLSSLMLDVARLWCSSHFFLGFSPSGHLFVFPLLGVLGWGSVGARDQGFSNLQLTPLPNASPAHMQLFVGGCSNLHGAWGKSSLCLLHPSAPPPHARSRALRLTSSHSLSFYREFDLRYFPSRLLLPCSDLRAKLSP